MGVCRFYIKSSYDGNWQYWSGHDQEWIRIPEETPPYSCYFWPASSIPCPQYCTTDGWTVYLSNGSSFTTDGGYEETYYAPNTAYARYFYNPPTVTLTYVANGADGGSAPSAQTVISGNSVTVSGQNTLYKTGYDFGGWNTNSGGTGTTYWPGSSYTVNQDSRLYAKWNLHTYTATFDAKGGSPTPSSINFYYGDTITLPSAPSRTGYTFNGWNVDDYTRWPGETSQKLYGDIYISAMWSVNTYTVSFNKNTTDTVTNMPSNTSGQYGTSITISSTVPLRTGYNFQNWNTNSSGTGIAVSAGGSYIVPASNTTLYARWQIQTYTVSFDANGGSGAPSDQTKTYGVTLKLSSVKPTKTDYIFQGWAKSSTASVAIYQPGDDFNENSNTKLYAVWKHRQLIISLYRNDGTTSYGTYKVDYGGNFSFSEATLYRRISFNFLGWNADASATSAGWYINSTMYNITEDKTLYYIWQKKTISLFTWADDVASGEKVSSAITADKWGILVDDIVTIYDDINYPSSLELSKPSSGDRITASYFNTARNRIANLPGVTAMVNPVSSGGVVYADLFRGNGSIMNGINLAITNYNTRTDPAYIP